MKQMLRPGGPFLLACVVAHSPARANLVLTEVDFSTNTIEITNTGPSACPGTSLDWCVPFAYGPAMESGGFTFAAGESRTYVIPFALSPTVGEELWIYLDNSDFFEDESEVVTGVVWGSDQSGAILTRISEVVNESSAWSSTSDFVPTAPVPSDHTLQLLPGSPPAHVSSSWTVAPANLGSYQATVDLVLGIKAGPNAGEVVLFWPTSTPAGVTVECSTTLLPDSFSPLAVTPTVVGENNEVTLTATGFHAFRLSL